MLTSSYPRYDSDNSSPFLLHLVKNLRSQGTHIHVIAPDSNLDTSPFDEHVHYFRYFFRPWQRLAYGSGILPNLKNHPALWILVPFFVASMFFTLITITRKYKPDVIHAHWVLPQGFLAVLAGILLKKPVVVSAHGADAYAYRSRLLMAIKQFTLSHCNSWTANTVATASAACPNLLRNKAVIIPMGVEVSHFSSGSTEILRKKDDRRNIILFVGRLVEKKGVDDLIRAMAALPDDLRKTTILWVIGEGHKRTGLVQLASELGISDAVKFWGQIPNQDLPQYYAAADLFVGPSVADSSGDTEGQGVVFIEAFASKVCVIATRTGGIPEVIADGETGILVDPNRPDQLAREIQNLLLDKQKRQRLASNAFKIAYDKYDWKNVSERFNQLYDQLLSNSHNATSK